MHELSIAMRVVETLGEELALAPDERVEKVTMKVGALSGVVPEALAFAWGEVTGETPLAGSRLEVEFVEASAWCAACGAEREVAPNRLACPACGGATPEVVRGRELDVISVEVCDGDAAR